MTDDELEAHIDRLDHPEHWDAARLRVVAEEIRDALADLNAGGVEGFAAAFVLAGALRDVVAFLEVQARRWDASRVQ